MAWMVWPTAVKTTQTYQKSDGVNYHSETSSRKSISAWLLSALNRNLPYNRFVEQLLPEGRGEPTIANRCSRETLTATMSRWMNSPR